jgi:hypothetical protein
VSFSNLPPGCRESDLPGCSREDERAEAMLEEMDNYEGWLLWLQSAGVVEDFEIFCFDKYWSELKEDFAKNLHPATASELDLDPEDPIGDNWPVWSLFLFIVLNEKRRRELVEEFVGENRRDFEEWAIV